MMLSATNAPCFAGQCLTNRKLHQRTATQKLRLAPCAAIQLDDLPYSLDALEPHMSKSTFEVHWGKHHRTYVNNLNNQIQGKDLESKSLEEIVKATWNGGSPSPEFNNAAQSWNHKFFWHSMKPGGGGEPSGELKSAIEKDFGSIEDFKKEFSTAGATQFGSGWAWLVKDGDKLKVIKTPNAETPLASGAGVPLLTMDVWEHAYYLDVQNRRPDYIKTFLGELVNWDAVAERFASA
ncbi:TPA: Fibronectin type III and SPRY domain-containing protein 1 [Trebouxia sp. C0005]